MKTICNLNYTDNVKKIMDEIIKEAHINIFDNYYLIVDDPLFFEEALLLNTDTLFNIQAITYNQLIKQLLTTFDLQKYQPLTKLEKILILKQLIEQSDNMFNTYDKIDLINELLQIFDLFYQYDLKIDHLKQLPPKIKTIINLYTTLKETTIDNHVFKVEDLLFDKIDHQIKNNHYYFISEQILTPKRFKLIQTIDQYSDVTLLLTNANDDRALNQIYRNFKQGDVVENNQDTGYLKHLNNQIFSLSNQKYNGNHPLYTINQTTPKAEIESVVLNIYTDLANHHGKLHDYAIYYPNDQYLTLLLETLANFDLPHNINASKVFKEFEACLLLIRLQIHHQDEDLIDLLDSQVLKRFNDDNYVDSIKKRYLETAILDDYFSDYQFNSCRSLNDFAQVLINFINQEMIINENSLFLLNFFKELNSDIDFTINDFYLLLQVLKPQLKQDQVIYNDHIYLLNYQQCYSGIVGCKQIYLTGLNETVVPKQFKDTGILLDQDYQSLHLPGLYEANSKEQNNLLKVINSNLNYVVLSLAHGTIDGQTLLESSLYQQLKTMFKLHQIDCSKDYLHPSLNKNLYLKGGNDQKQVSLNNLITYYKQSKNQPVALTVPLFSNNLSASKLETYNGCPYRYFNQYGLKLYPFKQPVFQNNEIGSITHYLLEKSQTFLKAKTIVIEELKQHILKTLNEYLFKNNLNDRLNNTNNQYIIKMIQMDIVNTIIVLNQQLNAGDFNIVASEVDITKQYPDFKLTGIVDRVDQYGNYLKVIDYKSSNKDLDISLAIQGFNIQMLLYLDALMKQENLDYGALLYFNTKRRILSSKKKINEAENSDNYLSLYKMNGYVNEKIINNIDHDLDKTSNIVKVRYVKKDDCYKGNILSSFNIKRLLDYVTNHIEELYQQISQGNIQINPKGSDDPNNHTKVNPCTYCNYRSICQFDVFYNEYTLINNENLEYLIKEGEENGA